MQLSIAKYSTVDLAFSSIVPSYVIQLVRAGEYEELFIARMFPLDVRYNIDIWYLTVLLLIVQHLLVLHPGSKRDLPQEIIFTAALIRTLWLQLIACITFMCGDKTYWILLCGSGATPGAFA